MQPKKEKREQLFKEIFDAAHSLGMKAGLAVRPTPMVVSQHADMLDDNSPVAQSWHVPEGACGFAWVVVRPGNSTFANWLRKTERASNHYYGGVSIWIGDHGQSVDRKTAHAHAMADYLQGCFPDLKITSGSRLD